MIKTIILTLAAGAVAVFFGACASTGDSVPVHHGHQHGYHGGGYVNPSK